MSIARNLPKYVIVMSGDVIPSARNLAHKFEIKTQYWDHHIRQFSPFKTTDHRTYLGLGKSDFPDAGYLFLGHASQSNFGNLSAKEFVTEFKKSIKASEYDKVTDIYMIGCEMGLPDADGKVLAQKIADEFAKQGFSKALRVHSISAPEINLSEKKAMYVEIINRGGAAAAARKEDPEGKLNAFVFTDAKDAHRYAALADLETQKSLSAHEIEEKKQLRARAHTFLAEADPLTELRKEYNIYRPDESLTARQTRISDEVNKEKEFAQKRLDAIRILREKIKHLRSKDKKDRAGRLEALTDLLEKKYSVDCRNHATAWMSLIKEYQKNWKYAGIMSETTHKLLEHLGNGDTTAAQEIIADQSKTKSQKKAEKKSKKKQKENPVSKSKLVNKDNSSSSNDTSSSSPDRDARYADSARSSDDEKPLLPNPDINNAKIYIDYLHAKLSGEVQRNSFVQFFTNLWGTKHHKLRAIEELRSVINKGGSFEDLKKKVDNILDENGSCRNDDPNKDINPTKVSHSILTSRTKDIFAAIQNKDANKLNELASIAKNATPSIKP